MKSFISKLPALGAALVLAGCAVSAISPEVRDRDLPDSWRGEAEYDAVRDGWLAQVGDAELSGLVTDAMEQNYRLAQLAADVEAARQAVIVSGAARLPELSMALNGSRRRVISNQFGITRTSSNFELGLDLFWELDVWGKLKDVEKQASLTWLAAQALYEDSRLRLAARVAGAWFDVIGAGDKLALLRERLGNLEEDLDIIEHAYNQGLTGALDVYLARTGVDQERARIAGQEQLLAENRITLQLLLGDYPDGVLEVDRTLPLLDSPIPAGLPSELISRRPDLQQAWMNLLASDAAVAIAHKQRFPRITLVAAGNDVSQGSRQPAGRQRAGLVGAGQPDPAPVQPGPPESAGRTGPRPPGAVGKPVPGAALPGLCRGGKRPQPQPDVADPLPGHPGLGKKCGGGTGPGL